MSTDSKKMRTVFLGGLVVRLRKGPLEKNYLAGLSTADYQKQRRALLFLEQIGVAKKLDDGRFAWVDYYSIEQAIENCIQERREGSDGWEEPSELDIALECGLPPEDLGFRRAFFKIARKLKYPASTKPFRPTE